jgi:protein-L-isoaspartate(D-aspartate) O-methyltransferase
MVEKQIRKRGVADPRVLAAMLAVPRAEFVPADLRDRAYEDTPLPIPRGQTISQPYIVAAMSAALALKGHETVLDVGTGSGYQAALLAHLAARVYSIERDHVLLEEARGTLARLGLLDRITLLEGDGTRGYPPAAPYDGIVVGAGAPDVPHSLVEQLGEGGRLVIPIGDRWLQDLVLLRKIGGKTARSVISGCRFVPLVGEEGW